MSELPYLTMAELDLAGKRVFIREDLNVPLKNGRVTNDERINRALPTIKMALEKNARVVLLSHLGRPEEGEYDAAYSLAPVAKALSKKLHHEVPLLQGDFGDITVAPGQVALCENVRFNVGEKQNDDTLAKHMASQCDVFVMDAFATAHRAQASTVGIAKYAPVACAGPLLVAELDALTKALSKPARPLVAVVGGAKVSTKIHVLENLLDKVDMLIVGGGIANTFLKAHGFPVGGSLYEPDWLSKAKQFFEKAAAKNVTIPLPTDVVVASELTPEAETTIKTVADVEEKDSIFDVGPKTIASYGAIMQKAATIIWNGPLGVFEMDAFSNGTQALANAIADSSAYSIAGGGDTLAALDKFGVTEGISYISTGGGAFLALVEGHALPAVTELERRKNG